MNNVEIAILKLRELQGIIFDRHTSPDKLFKKTEEMMMYMNRASKEIQTNYEEISKKLTDQLNTGKPQ